MQLNATSGQGDATLAVTIARNDLAAARSGAISVNNQRATISQEPRPCTYELRASTQSLSSEGGRGTVAIETLSGCNWTAASSAVWLQVLTASGSGSGSVGFEAAANSGAAREATIAIAGQSVTIGQNAGDMPGGPPPCAATLTPSAVNAVAAGGTHTVALSTGNSCNWTATTNAPWITVAPGTGQGNSTLMLTVARNTGAARSAMVSAGGQSTTINQAAAPACTATIEPATASFGAIGGEGRVRVTTPDGCEWSASASTVPWLQITAGGGTGNGEARYTVAPNTLTVARSTTLTIGGRSHTVSQEAAAAPTCTFSLQPTSQNFAAGSASGQFAVTTQAGCAWTASAASGQTWVTITSTSATTVSFSVAANTATSPRQTTITVTDGSSSATFSVTQDAAAPPACTFTLQPTSQNFGVGGASSQFTVTTQTGCAWTASVASGQTWVTVTSTSATTVSFSVAPNTVTTPRQTTITVTGGSSSATFSVSQDAAAPPACVFTLQPTSQNFAAGAGTGQFTVTTQTGCTWTASAASGQTWVTVTSTSATTVSFSVAANTAPSTRQTTITVSGGSGSATFSVTQDAAAGAEGER